MKTREYLKQIERLDLMIEKKLEEISELRALATSISVVQKEVNVQTSGDKDQLGKAISKIVDLERETDELIDRYVEKRHLIIRQIDEIKDKDQYRLLMDRYVLKKYWEDIIDEWDCSRSKILTLHREALRVFENMYGRQYLHL